MHKKPFFLFVIVLFIVMAAPHSFAGVYKWVDEKGQTHITDYPNPAPKADDKIQKKKEKTGLTTEEIEKIMVEPEAAALSVRTLKGKYAPFEEIDIEFSGLPGNQQDWITLVKSSDPENTYGQWFYTKGKQSGRYTFNGMPAGSYEIRTYLDWPKGGYQVMASHPFTVAEEIPAVAAVKEPEAPVMPAPSPKIAPPPSETQPPVEFPAPVEIPDFPSPFTTPEGAIPEMFLQFFAAFAVVLVIIGIALYVFYSLCLFKIGKKLDVPASWLAWVPVANGFWPLVGASGKPWWWIIILVVASIIPIVNILSIFLFIYLWMCVSENMGRNKWLGLLVILPFVNFVFMGYLAFSKMPGGGGPSYAPAYEPEGMGYAGPEPPGAEFLEEEAQEEEPPEGPETK